MTTQTLLPCDRTVRLRILVKLVSDPANGQNVVRFFWIGLEFLPQAIDVRIDVSLIPFILSAPNSVEEIIPRPGTPRLRGQQFKYLKLEWSQVNSDAAS